MAKKKLMLKRNKKKLKQEVNEKMARTNVGSDGWEDLDSGAVAMHSSKSDYKEGGKHYVGSGFGFNTGSSSELKSKLGNMRPGEVKTLHKAENWKLQKKLSSEPGQKSCEYRLVESDGLDDSAPNNSTSAPYSSESPSGDLTPLQIMKNVYDKLTDRVTKLDGKVLGLGIATAVIGTVVVVLALKLFF